MFWLRGTIEKAAILETFFEVLINYCTLILVPVESIEIRSVNSDTKIIFLNMPIWRYSLLDKVVKVKICTKLLNR